MLRIARVVAPHALNKQWVITLKSFNGLHAARVVRAVRNKCAYSASDHLGNHTQLLKHGQVIREAALLDNLTIAQTQNSDIPKSYRFTCGRHTVHGTGICSLNQQLHNNVFTAVDKQFYLFAVIGKTYPNASCKRSDPFNTRAPVDEGIVSRKIFSVKLFPPINLTFGPDDVAGFSTSTLGACVALVCFASASAWANQKVQARTKQG